MPSHNGSIPKQSQEALQVKAEPEPWTIEYHPPLAPPVKAKRKCWTCTVCGGGKHAEDSTCQGLLKNGGSQYTRKLLAPTQHGEAAAMPTSQDSPGARNESSSGKRKSHKPTQDVATSSMQNAPGATGSSGSPPGSLRGHKCVNPSCISHHPSHITQPASCIADHASHITHCASHITYHGLHIKHHVSHTSYTKNRT